VTIEAREQAVQALYQADVTGRDELPPDLSPRARRLVEGVHAHRREIDRALAEAAEHWSVERMPAVDRAILRLGVYELRYCPGTPTAVIVAEAVRIAKAYSTDKSGRFVNGVLATIARTVRGDER